MGVITIITAAWVAPIVGPMVRDGAVVIDGDRITAVGSARDLGAAYPDAQHHDAGNALILPGLVNAHAHLELSGCSAGDSPASFVDWIASLQGKLGPAPD